MQRKYSQIIGRREIKSVQAINENKFLMQCLHNNKNL
jgi:hypothetical protein